MATLWGSSGLPERPLLMERRLRQTVSVRPAVTNRTLAIWYLTVCAAWYWIAGWMIGLE
jgi:hypothetical protein